MPTPTPQTNPLDVPSILTKRQTEQFPPDLKPYGIRGRPIQSSANQFRRISRSLSTTFVSRSQSFISRSGSFISQIKQRSRSISPQRSFFRFSSRNTSENDSFTDQLPPDSGNRNRTRFHSKLAIFRRSKPAKSTMTSERTSGDIAQIDFDYIYKRSERLKKLERSVKETTPDPTDSGLVKKARILPDGTFGIELVPNGIPKFGTSAAPSVMKSSRRTKKSTNSPHSLPPILSEKQMVEYLANDWPSKDETAEAFVAAIDRTLPRFSNLDNQLDHQHQLNNKEEQVDPVMSNRLAEPAVLSLLAKDFESTASIWYKSSLLDFLKVYGIEGQDEGDGEDRQTDDISTTAASLSLAGDIEMINSGRNNNFNEMNDGQIIKQPFNSRLLQLQTLAQILEAVCFASTSSGQRTRPVGSGSSPRTKRRRLTFFHLPPLRVTASEPSDYHWTLQAMIEHVIEPGRPEERWDELEPLLNLRTSSEQSVSIDVHSCSDTAVGTSDRSIGSVTLQAQSKGCSISSENHNVKHKPSSELLKKLMM